MKKIYLQGKEYCKQIAKLAFAVYAQYVCYFVLQCCKTVHIVRKRTGRKMINDY